MDKAIQQAARVPGSTQRLFRALSDSTRQRLLQLLLREPLNVTELVEVLKQPQSTISRHLKVLRAAGLVRDRRSGTAALYHAVESPEAEELHSMLHGWLKAQPLSRPLEEGLRRVIRQRDRTGVGFFERLGNQWDELRSTAFGDAFATEALVGLLPRTWTVADIGSGTGFLLPTLAANFENVIAVEPAAAMLEGAKRRVVESGAKNVTFQQGDLSHLPIADATCDLVIACLVLHHVPRPADALAEMRRVLRPGGRLLLIEQQSHENQTFYETMQDLWWGFEPQALAAEVTAAGFAQLDHRTLHLARPAAAKMEAPALFVIHASRPDEINQRNRKP